jgi:hypothetical protein
MRGKADHFAQQRSVSEIAARVVERAARIRVWLPTACQHAALFKMLAGRFATTGP